MFQRPLFFQKGRKLQKEKNSDAEELKVYVHQYQEIDNLKSSVIRLSSTNLEHCSKFKKKKYNTSIIICSEEVIQFWVPVPYPISWGSNMESFTHWLPQPLYEYSEQLNGNFRYGKVWKYYPHHSSNRLLCSRTEQKGCGWEQSLEGGNKAAQKVPCPFPQPSNLWRWLNSLVCRLTDGNQVVVLNKEMHEGIP